MPRITVRLFAGLRERAGLGTTALELPEGAVAGDVWALLDLGERPPGIAFAVNRAYASEDTPLANGDEVALIPPVSGGSDEPRIGVAITADPIDIAAAHAAATSALFLRGAPPATPPPAIGDATPEDARVEPCDAR